MRIILSILLMSVCYSDIIYVPGDPDNSITIQEGIDIASDGDTVLVAQGVYHENLVLHKTITLASYALYDDLTNWYEFSTTFGNHQLTNENIANTKIVGDLANPDLTLGSCLLINSPDDECITPTIIGFTFKDGIGTTVVEMIDGQEVKTKRGGGIMVNNAVPEIHYNFFTENKDDIHSGGGLYIGEDIGIEDYLREDRNECDEVEIDISHNFYRDNFGGYGRTLSSNWGDIQLKMTSSVFDVYVCPDTLVTPVWVYMEEETDVNFEDGEGDFCAFSSDVYVDIDGTDFGNDGSEPFQTITFAMGMIVPDSLNPVTEPLILILKAERYYLLKSLKFH